VIVPYSVNQYKSCKLCNIQFKILNSIMVLRKDTITWYKFRKFIYIFMNQHTKVHDIQFYDYSYDWWYLCYIKLLRII